MTVTSPTRAPRTDGGLHADGQPHLRGSRRGELPLALFPIELEPHDVQVPPALRVSPCPRFAPRSFSAVVLNEPMKMLLDDEPTWHTSYDSIHTVAYIR